jgi:hypothetical protein
MNNSEINREYHENVDRLIKLYGEMAMWTSAPRDEVDFINELYRARFVLLVNPDDPAALRKNAVPQKIIDFLGVKEQDSRKERRSDKYAKILDWCEDHRYHQVTAEQIAEISEISYPTALKFMKSRPDLFHQVKRGLYEVKDPDLERMSAKESANSSV